MPENAVIAAAGLLKRHYGLLPGFGPPGDWLTLVRVVLERDNLAKKGRDWSWLDESPLRTPGETAATTVPRLEECLTAAAHAGRHATVLHRLAEWWLRRFSDVATGADFERHSLKSWQDELRAIRGVSWETTDRILLFVGGLDVYPLDRGSLRIAARHGWMESTAEYEDWQAFFAGGLAESDIELSQASLWNLRVGREFCGAHPKCGECPLKVLLPARGPIPLGDDE